MFRFVYLCYYCYNNNNNNNNNNNFFSGSTKRRTRELIMDGVEERNSDHVTNHTQYVEINEIHSYELKRDDIKFERLVGSGNFGEVFKATIDNNTVAVKSLKGKIYVTLPCFCLHSTSCSLWFPDQSANTKRQIFTLCLWVSEQSGHHYMLENEIAVHCFGILMLCYIPN